MRMRCSDHPRWSDTGSGGANSSSQLGMHTLEDPYEEAGPSSRGHKDRDLHVEMHCVSRWKGTKPSTGENKYDASSASARASACAHTFMMDGSSERSVRVRCISVVTTQ